MEDKNVQNSDDFVNTVVGDEIINNQDNIAEKQIIIQNAPVNYPEIHGKEKRRGNIFRRAAMPILCTLLGGAIVFAFVSVLSSRATLIKLLPGTQIACSFASLHL